MKKYIVLILLMLLVFSANAGEHGSSLDFDGVDQYVSITPIILSGTGSTIEMGFNLNDIGGMFVGNSGNSNTYIILSTTTKIRIQTDIIGTYKDFIVPTISMGAWYHLIITRNSNITKVYLNIIESSSGGQSQSDDLTIDQIGKYYTGIASWYDGKIDNIKIWDRALELTEIAWNYRHPGTVYNTDGLVGWWKLNEFTGITAYDSSGLGNDGDLINNPTWNIQTPVIAGKEK